MGTAVKQATLSMLDKTRPLPPRLFRFTGRGDEEFGDADVNDLLA